MKQIKNILILGAFSAMFASCYKPTQINDAPYPDQLVYMPAAVEGNSSNGIYFVNRVATLGQGFRYVADVAGSKLNIPLAAYRSGVNSRGSIPVTITTNADTVARLIAANRFPAGTPTELLPADRFTVPNGVVLADGASDAVFNLSIDLNFLLANVTKRYAVAVAAAVAPNAPIRFGTTIVYIEPAFLIPTASFTRTIVGRTVNFSNTSLNSNDWSWNYGDGSPARQTRSDSYTYANPGTYTITLTARGALGSFNPSTVSSTVVIP
jgi:hypothetical protein